MRLAIHIQGVKHWFSIDGSQVRSFGAIDHRETVLNGNNIINATNHKNQWNSKINRFFSFHMAVISFVPEYFLWLNIIQ